MFSPHPKVLKHLIYKFLLATLATIGGEAFLKAPTRVMSTPETDQPHV